MYIFAVSSTCSRDRGSTGELNVSCIDLRSMSFSVDELHEIFDGFFLSIFEAIRGHEVLSEPNADELKGQRLKAVTDKYKDMMMAIDNLEGIKMTKEEQEARLQEQSEQISSLRGSILQKQQTLLAKRKQIDEKLASMLSDEALALPGHSSP